MIRKQGGELMNQEDKKRYLDQWGHKCFTCGSYVDRENMFLAKSIVPLEREGVESTFHYFMVCPICKSDRILI